MQPLFARTPEPAGEQVAVVMGMVHDAVRDDLLEVGVVLDLGAGSVLRRGMDGAQDSLEATRDEPMPRAVRKDRRTRDTEDVLGSMRTASPRPDGRRSGHALGHPAHSFTRDA